MKRQIITIFVLLAILVSPNLIFADNSVSLSYSKFDGNTITGSVVIDMMDEINQDIIVDGGNLKIDTNVDIQKNKIILKNAKSIIIGSNTNISLIEGTTEKLEISSNADIDSIIATVSGDTKISANSGIKKVSLKTDTLELSANTNIGDGIIYVYKNFVGGVNGEFKGKLTVYGDSSLDVNTEFKGRFCSLGKVGLGVNSELETYNNDGLFGNIDPILKYTTEDNTKDFVSAKEISEGFDGRFSKAMKDIDSYNAQVNSLTNSLKLAKDEDKSNIQNEIDSKNKAKEDLKTSFIQDIESTFTSLTPMIDEKSENKELFQNIKEMYTNAIGIEDDLLVYQICNNSEISGDINSVYIKGGKILYGNTYFKREQIIKDKQEESITKMLDIMPDERILNITTKVDKLLEMFAKKGYNSKNARNMNTLMDIKDLLREETLY